MNFLAELMESTKELEPPRSFWYWSGLTAISAVVMDNVWLPRGEMKDSKEVYFKMFPNIYVMLHADSGLKKGPPVALAKDLVRRVNCTKIISGRSSIQAILKELGTSSTEPGGKIKNKSAAFIASSEFSSSIVEDRAAMTILTDLYDRHWNEGDWRSLLKMEIFSLKDPIVTLLVATNAAHFDDFIGLKDVNGGFIGRMFMIVERETSVLNPLINELEMVPNREKLANYLKTLSTLKGPFQSLRGTPAGNLYHNWYMDFYEQIKKQHVKDDTGTIQRFGDSILKVAMLLSLSRDTSLIIDEPTMHEAISQCERLISSARQTTIGKKGKASNIHLKNLILEELRTREPHMISHEQLTKKYWMHYDSLTALSDIMIGFHDAGLIKVENRGSVVVYIMPDLAVEKLNQFMAGKRGD